MEPKEGETRCIAVSSPEHDYQAYQDTKVPNIHLRVPTAAKDYLWSTVMVWLDRVNAKLLS
jgi:hypothetical protein